MMTFRSCQPDDAEALAQLEADATAFPWSARQYRDSLTGGHAGIALEVDGKLIGLAIIMTVLDDAEILNIAIDRAHQRQGHGRQLLQHLLRQLAENGTRRVFLEVRESNLAAHTLYEQCGFSDCGLRKDYYPCANGREHAVLMETVIEPTRSDY